MRFREWIKKINIKGIWERNAFYILLAGCIVIMGAVAWTSRSRQDPAPQTPPAEEKLAVTPLPEPELSRREYFGFPDFYVEEEPEIEDNPEEAVEEIPESPEAPASPDTEVPVEETPADTPPANEPNEEPDEPIIETAAQAAVWQSPLPGTVITPYAADQLVYWETLGAWRVHAAVDIKPDRDTAVFAAADGTVSLVIEDDMLGYMVVIDHDDGLQTCYASLTEDILVKAGDLVLSGRQIGTAGNTARSEQAQGVHLHFAVWQDGQSVDPLSYISVS